MATKINKLTGMNVRALDEAKEQVGLRVETTATTATFPDNAENAYHALNVAAGQMAAKHGRRGHPVQSLHAVLRKLDALR